MLRKLLYVVATLIATVNIAYSQSGTLKGTVTDRKTGEPMPFVNVIIESGGTQLGGGQSDINGNYTIKPIPPGTYDLRASNVGYQTFLLQGIVINPDRIIKQDISLNPTMEQLEAVEIVSYKVPLIEQDNTTTGGTMTSEEIQKMPGRSAQSVATTMGGVFTDADGNMGSVRGSRTEGTVTYIDGMKVIGSSAIPKSAIDQVSVMMGGIPAKYGDATGGILNITTKGPSRDFGGGVELVTSQIFDPYNYNLAAFSLFGPIWKDSSNNTVTSKMGFFLSGEVNHVLDNDPSAIGWYRVNENTLADLEQNPLTNFNPYENSFLSSGTYKSAEFLRSENFENIDAAQNSKYLKVNLAGRLDFRTSKTTNLIVGGSFNRSHYNEFSIARSLMNWEENPEVTAQTWRGYARFTQRFPTTDTNAFIKNVYYTIQADFSNYDFLRQDETHQDNFFEYGYVGKFDVYDRPNYELDADTLIIDGNPVYVNNFYHYQGQMDTFVEFSPSDINPLMANYTSRLYNLYNETNPMFDNIFSLRSNRALLNGDFPDNVYGLYNNVGTPGNAYTKYNQQQIGLRADASADLGNHAIEFGVQFEQQTNRLISYSPVALWSYMRLWANSHVSQLDVANPQILIEDQFDATDVFPVYGNPDGVMDTIVQYGYINNMQEQFYFDYNLRSKLGLPVDGNDQLQTDALPPDFYSLDMFSPDELLNNGFGTALVDYYGFDHTGEKYGSNPSFDDFFTQTESYGAGSDNTYFTRPVGAYEPIYMAGYIQDKFAFEDLIFNIGVRVDRFDANQFVLKDNYLFYSAKSVKEVNALGTDGSIDVNHPGNMGDDYVIYVNNIQNPTEIIGYRNGDIWYDSEGNEVDDPLLSVSEGGLNTPSGILPYLNNPGADTTNVSSEAFTDYEPQLNFNPRIAFSFPLSDVATFFANYSVLTSRPSAGQTRLNPMDYYFIRNVGTNLINNPSLKPEKNIEYEVGFKQKVSETSAINFSAYYKEMRDQIQVFRFDGSYPNTYFSFNNVDFGTVKGFTLGYDLRRTGNIWLKAYYTLQFADGTGSSATSALSRLRNPAARNIRIYTPLNYDQRHQIKGIVDYRYARGKFYNGPEIGDFKVLENTGLNVIVTGGSGTPYTKSSEIYSPILGVGSAITEGSYNGARLPWQFKVDIRLDRDFYIGKAENEDDNIFINAYIEIFNVLDADNIMGVYRATGEPDDDGFLNAAQHQDYIEGRTDEQAFRDYYAIRVNSPYNYAKPRIIRLGLSLNF